MKSIWTILQISAICYVLCLLESNVGRGSITMILLFHRIKPFPIAEACKDITATVKIIRPTPKANVAHSNKPSGEIYIHTLTTLCYYFIFDRTV